MVLIFFSPTSQEDFHIDLMREWSAIDLYVAWIEFLGCEFASWKKKEKRTQGCICGRDAYYFRLEEMWNGWRVHTDLININYSVHGEPSQFFIFYSLCGGRNNSLIFHLSLTNELRLAFESIKHGFTEFGSRLLHVIQEHGELGQGF